MGLARACGLTHTGAWTEQMGGATGLVAERYDRRVDNGTVQRLHQEDMCQAVGLRPREKYAIGRPSEPMSRLLPEFADDPYPQTLRLFGQLVFRAVVGDEDGHGKNYSLLLDPDGTAVTLAPRIPRPAARRRRPSPGSAGHRLGWQSARRARVLMVPFPSGALPVLRQL